MSEIGAGTGSSYPGTLDTNSTVEVNSPAGGKTKARAEVPNDLAAAIVAIETELGTDPAGTATDVKTNLQTQHNTDGTHKAAIIYDGSAYRSASATPAANTVPVSDANGRFGAWNPQIVNIAAPNPTAVVAGATSYQTFGDSTVYSSQSTAEVTMPTKGVIKLLYVRAIANTLNSTLVVTLVKNGSPTALTATITSGSTSVFTDLSNSVSVDVGDKLCWTWAASAGTGSATLGPLMCTIQ